MIKLTVLAAICLLVTSVAQSGSCGSSKANLNMASSPSSPQNGKLAPGLWGGEHIQAQVTENGVEIEFDCARGSIANQVLLDSQGRFHVTGKFIPEHAGPIRRDEESNERAAQYSGAVKEKEMTLKITDSTTKEVIGDFKLTHGADGRIRKCR